MRPVVLRRPARVALVAAPPPAPVRVVAKLTPAEERERLVRNRDVERRAEVVGIFAKLGAVDLGDPLKSARGQYRAGGDA